MTSNDTSNPAAAARPAPGYAGDLTPAETWAVLEADERAVLVDVRTEAEWQQIGVPDVAGLGRQAVFTEWVVAGGRPNPAFLDQLAAAGLEPGDERPVLFLCRSGQRSIGAARAATAAGIGPSYNVLEGFEGAPGVTGVRDREGWKVAGLPWGLPGDAPTTTSPGEQTR